MRIIGDVHGKYAEYLKIAKSSERTIQIGDLGFDYECLNELDPAKHKVLAGNHDNYHAMHTEHWLGDYGVYDNFFYVRGGRSIDRNMRIKNVSWWPEEELSYGQMNDALLAYTETQPQIVLSHECPRTICEIAFGFATFQGELIQPSMTAKMLEAMFNSYRPKVWVFGHYHRHYDETIGGTRFVCLPELGVMDI